VCSSDLQRLRNQRIDGWTYKNLLIFFYFFNILFSSWRTIMENYAHFYGFENFICEKELFLKVKYQIQNRYEIDEKLASEMAWDLIEVLTAIDCNLGVFENFFLH